MELKTHTPITPADVRAVLSRHLLADGLPMVLDLEHSNGVNLVDAETGRTYLDLFGFYASSALGMNHPKMLNDPDFQERLLAAAVNKVTNSDVYTLPMARMVDTFSRVGIPEYMPYTFFVEGGALAVENALKTAFDYKVQKNFMKGYRREVGHAVLHFDQAFHGRSGYTLSLTNTADPRKTQYFPMFKWPRILNPFIVFPMEGAHLEDLERREQLSLLQAKQAFYEHGDDIACIIIEPIQGEGGDNHFRASYLQALKDLAHENDALLIFDEVQTGVGITGSFWAHQAIGVTPDILSFGKKTQVCGILAGHKLDEIDGHVFQTSSRINSTWGGNLSDMVRFDRTLEIIEEEDLVTHAGTVGAYLKQRLHEMAAEHPSMSSVRGRGLFCAFTLPSTGFRNRVLDVCWEEGIVILGSGTHSIRFRPPLNINESEIDQGLALLSKAIGRIEREGASDTAKGRK